MLQLWLYPCNRLPVVLIVIYSVCPLLPLKPHPLLNQGPASIFPVPKRNNRTHRTSISSIPEIIKVSGHHYLNYIQTWHEAREGTLPVPQSLTRSTIYSPFKIPCRIFIFPCCIHKNIFEIFCVACHPLFCFVSHLMWFFFRSSGVADQGTNPGGGTCPGTQQGKSRAEGCS